MVSSLVVSCFLCMGQPDIGLPPTSKTDVGVFLSIAATTKGEVVQFVSLDPGLSIFPSNLLADKKTTVVVAAKPGKYRLLAYTSIENKPSLPAYTLVIVGNPDDNNKPEPVDPKPVDPKPNPDIPTPDDGFISSLKSIYGGLQEPDKNENVKKFQGIFSFAVVEADNKNNKTLGDLYSVYRANVLKAMPAGKIQPVKDTISDYLDKSIGTDTALLSINLDDALRKKCKDLFQKMANILGGLNE